MVRRSLRIEFDVEGGRAGILAGQRLGDIRPAHLEDVRAARGVGEEVHHPGGVLAEVLRQGIGLAERLVEDDERQVDRELHAGAGADRADMLEAAAELLEDRPGAGDIRLLAARQADELAGARRADGAADGALDEGRALGASLLGEPHLGLRLHGAHVDDELAGDAAGKDARWAAVDRIDRRGVGQDRDDRLGAGRELGRALRHLGAGIGERLRLLGRAVPDHEVMADLLQALRDGHAHAAETSDADAHR